MKAFAHLPLLILLLAIATTTNTQSPPTTATTPAPPTTATTSAPPTTSTTPAPPTTATTPAPQTTSTTPAPATTATTPAPPTTTTTTTTTVSPGTTTTVSPGTTSTTVSPGTTSTVSPGTTSTTVSPGTTTTVSPGTTSTTVSPGTTTTVSPGTTSTTVSPGTTSTVSPGTTTTVSPGTTTTTTIAPTSSSVISPGLCREDSCSSDASCVELNNDHFCLCFDGYYYNSSTCKKGKVFPGTIKVNVSETSGLEDEKSVAYKNLYVKIITFFEGAFANSDFGQTVIHKVRIPAAARSEMRAGNKLVDVTVVNLFAENTKENEMTVSSAIDNAVANNRDNFSDYATQDRCEFYGCQKANAQDDCRDLLKCKCKPELARPNPQTAMCLALGTKCPDDCKAERNMQCLVRSGGKPECVCLPGYQKDAQGNCQACPFGYSGDNCEDNFQLILTIVGTIAGILILGMVIALIVLRSKKNKGIEEQNLIENDFQSLRMTTTGFSNLGAEGSIFPKVRATLKDGPTQNPYSQNPYGQRNMPRPDY